MAIVWQSFRDTLLLRRLSSNHPAQIGVFVMEMLFNESSRFFKCGACNRLCGRSSFKLLSTMAWPDTQQQLRCEFVSTLWYSFQAVQSANFGHSIPQQENALQPSSSYHLRRRLLFLMLAATLTASLLETHLFMRSCCGEIPATQPTIT